METGSAAEDVQVLNAIIHGSNAFFQNFIGLTLAMKIRNME